MSITIKACPNCGQVNPENHDFCPVCGRVLGTASRKNAPWTISVKYPPLAAAIDPTQRLRRRVFSTDGRGTGLVWIGFILAAIPIGFNTGSSISYLVLGLGVAAVVGGFWQMRRDAPTLGKAGLATNGIALISLAAIAAKLISTGHATTPVNASIAALPTQAAEQSVASTPSADVPMYGGSSEHTGALAGPGITGRPFRAWRFDTAGELYSSPAVVNGVLYIGTKAGSVYALDARNGTERWSSVVGDVIVRSSPAVIDDRLFIGSGYSLFALDSTTGRPLWQTQTSFASSSSPAVSGGVVYVATQANMVYAIEASSGKQLWSYTTNGPIFSSPTVTSSTVLIGSDKGKLTAIDSDSGTVLWARDVNGGIFSSPAVYAGSVFVTSAGGKIYSINLASGDIQWSYDAGGDASPTVFGSTVYVAGNDGGLYALDTITGTPKWLVPTGHQISVSPVIAQGIVYVASGSTLYAVAGDTGAIVWQYAAGYEIETSPVVIDGFVYIGGRDGFLDAITGDGSAQT